MPIYNETKLMFIQDINNLSSGFMPSQGTFLWSDKLYLELTEKMQVRFRLNASTFYLKRNYVLLQTQGRSIQNARAFSEAFRRGWKEGKLDGLSGLAGIFTNCIYAGCGNKYDRLVSTPVYRKLEKPVTTRQPVKCKLV